MEDIAPFDRRFAGTHDQLIKARERMDIGTGFQFEQHLAQELFGLLRLCKGWNGPDEIHPAAKILDIIAHSLKVSDPGILRALHVGRNTDLKRDQHLLLQFLRGVILGEQFLIKDPLMSSVLIDQIQAFAVCSEDIGEEYGPDDLKGSEIEGFLPLVSCIFGRFLF